MAKPINHRQASKCGVFELSNEKKRKKKTFTIANQNRKPLWNGDGGKDKDLSGIFLPFT